MSGPPQPVLVSQLFQRAITLHQKGQLAEAERAYRQVVNAKPDHVEALHLLGVLRFQQGHHEEALNLIAAALKVAPRYPEALFNRGNILAQLERYDEAIASYDQVLATIPNYPEAHHNRGNSLFARLRFEEALASYDNAIAGRRDYVEALDSRGNTLRHLNRFEEALASYDRALAINPRDAGVHNNRGSVLRTLKRHEEAIQSYDEAIAIEPNFVDALLNRGYALIELVRFEEALASYAKALAIQPDNADTHLSEANCRLLIGDFDRGWEEYEWRWNTYQWTPFKRNFSQPLWLGEESIAGKAILILAEAGLGDTIHFCRYARLLSDASAQVILEVQRPLKSLLSTLETVQTVLARGEPLPPFDFFCPMMSLPRAFNTRLDTIPGKTPYIRAPADRIEHWRARFPQSGALRVGLAWSTSAAGKFGGGNRWLAFKQLAPLLSVDGISFISLHRERDLSREDALAVAASGRIVDFGSEQPDLVDAAAMISGLDLVISVDTALGHLAGALGVPVWIMLPFSPEWRWLLERTDSPWYPTARLFRQPKLTDWDSVLAEVAQELVRMKEARPRP